MSNRSADRFDAVVIGFGPSGAVATGLLGKAGLTVLAMPHHHRTARPRTRPRLRGRQSSRRCEHDRHAGGRARGAGRIHVSVRDGGGPRRNPYTFKTLSYDPVRDFIPVATIAKSNFILLVNPTIQAKTLPELIALDKSAPGKLSLAVDGPRNASGILGQYINKMAGSGMVLVPYNNNSTALQDTIAGRIQVTIQAASVAESFIKEGTLRPIAVASPQRLASLPDVSTMAETLPGVQLQGWFMIMAPAKTPVEIVSKLNQEIVRVLADPEVKQRAATLGFEIDPAGSGTPASAADFLKSELALWGKVTREVGLEPQ